MIAVIIFLSVSLTTAVVGSIVIWSMDALRADEIEAQPASVPAPRAPALPTVAPTSRTLPPAA